jgi:hypothetical protein
MPEPVKMSFAGVEFDIVQDEAAPAYFVFGVRKSGSSIMNSMVTSLARFNQVNYVDVAGQLFGKGVTVAGWQNDAGMATLLQGGNLFGGFRNAPLGLVGHPLLAASKKILLVRDPRDALVSEYFSSAYSHSIPEEGEGRQQMLENRARALKASVATYVLRQAKSFRGTLMEYREFIGMPGMRLYHYEDAIMNKRWFLEDICEHFGWTVTDQQLDQILGWADVLPDEERPDKFVRKVTPGDHRDKLEAEVILQLNDILAPMLDELGYSPTT